MSGPARQTGASRPGEGGDLEPYEAIASLVQREQAARPSPTPEEADTAFKRIAEATLKLFAEYARRHGRAPLADDHGLTATEAAVVSSHVLRAADVAVFELAMWESWAGGASIAEMSPDSVARRNADE